MSEKRKLGNSRIEVHPLCLGGNVFGWTADEPTSFKVLDGFLAADFEFIDTADMYSTWIPGHKGGESETIIGKWMKQRGSRKQVIIATKCGLPMGEDKKGLSKKYILQAAEDSLKRLQTDYIDLYQAHQDDPSTPLEETLEGFAQEHWCIVLYHNFGLEVDAGVETEIFVSWPRIAIGAAVFATAIDVHRVCKTKIGTVILRENRSGMVRQEFRLDHG